MKTILLTGDTGGLGVSILDVLLKKSNYKVIGISRSENQFVHMYKERYPEQYYHISFDLRNTENIKELYTHQIKKIGSIYGLVNNSAIAYDDIVTNANISKIEDMFQLNVFAPIMLTKYVIRDMLLYNIKGSIVNISSISAHTGYKGLSMYASTKGALEAFSKGVAREWGERGLDQTV